jgi:hypothetical protein
VNWIEDAIPKSIAQRLRRMRIGPLAVEGSTTRPRCVISTSPEATSRLAARLAGSMRSRHPSSDTARAASEGQIVAVAAREARRLRMVCSSAESIAVILRRRQASLQ